MRATQESQRSLPSQGDMAISFCVPLPEFAQSSSAPLVFSLVLTTSRNLPGGLAEVPSIELSVLGHPLLLQIDHRPVLVPLMHFVSGSCSVLIYCSSSISLLSNFSNYFSSTFSSTSSQFFLWLCLTYFLARPLRFSFQRLFFFISSSYV